MTMLNKSILIVDTYYPKFLDSIRQDLHKLGTFEQLHHDLMSYSFGTSDAYSNGLKKIGWTAAEIVPNFFDGQKIWGKEHSKRLWKTLDQLPPSYVSRVPFARNLWRRLPTLHKMLEIQIEEYDPKVVYFQDLNFAPPSLLKKLQKQGRLVVGQIASPLPSAPRLRMYDLILSSLPNQINQILDSGTKSEFLPIAFDDRILKRFPSDVARNIQVSFVGGISRNHHTTIPLLNSVQKANSELQIFGYGADSLRSEPALHRAHQGERWGLSMYDVLFRSRVTLNRHISISGDYANNMRLFEATGVGALLITDRKSNLDKYFLPGVEVLAYSSLNEAADMVKWATENPDDAEIIAARGQSRTLQDHTYDKCMVQLGGILEKHL